MRVIRNGCHVVSVVCLTSSNSFPPRLCLPCLSPSIRSCKRTGPSGQADFQDGLLKRVRSVRNKRNSNANSLEGESPASPRKTMLLGRSRVRQTKQVAMFSLAQNHSTEGSPTLFRGAGVSRIGYMPVENSRLFCTDRS